MFRSPRTFIFFLSSLGCATLIFDQLTKFLTKKIPADGIFLFHTTPISLKFQLAYNPAIAFSLPVARPIILILSVLIFAFLIFYIHQAIKTNKLVWSITLTLILSAAISNFLDRILFQNVIDFISLNLYNYSWPIFNLADTIIVISVIILLIHELKKPELKKDKL
jgi:signal peptidase II